MLRIKYTEHVTNEEVRKRTQQPMIGDKIRKRRMKWAGHVMRMDQSRNPKKILQYKPNGKRKAGRPKKRWIDGLEEDLKPAGITLHGKTSGRNRATLEELANNRETWRDVMEKSMAGTSRWMNT